LPVSLNLCGLALFGVRRDIWLHFHFAFIDGLISRAFTLGLLGLARLGALAKKK